MIDTAELRLLAMNYNDLYRQQGEPDTSTLGDQMARNLSQAADEIDMLRRVIYSMSKFKGDSAGHSMVSEKACEHRRYTQSPNGRMRQCQECFETATLTETGWEWP